MIGRVLPRGRRVQGVLRYLYKTGEDSRHVSPRVIGSWRHPIDVEPLVTGTGQRDFRPLTALLEQPLAIRDADRRPKRSVWHCVLRAAPADRNLTDAEWREIVRELMHRLGLSERGREGEGVRWVAVCHGDNHVHVVAVMARQDGRRAHVDREYIRVGEAARWAERTYKLHVTGRTDGTADRRPTRAEQEKARRAGRKQPPRVTLCGKVQAAAAAAGSETEFFSGLEARGVQVRLRRSPVTTGEVTGYAVGLPGDLSAGGGQVWYGGGKLAPDLTLPKLRTRWNATAPGGTGQASRAPIAEVYAQAAEAGRQAAKEIRAGKRGAADTARAAADLLAVAADVTGNPELRKAADGMSRAARAPWRRIPAASDDGRMLRTAAHVLAASRRHGIPPGYAYRLSCWRLSASPRPSPSCGRPRTGCCKPGPPGTPPHGSRRPRPRYQTASPTPSRRHPLVPRARPSVRLSRGGGSRNGRFRAPKTALVPNTCRSRPGRGLPDRFRRRSEAISA